MGKEVEGVVAPVEDKAVGNATGEGRDIDLDITEIVPDAAGEPAGSGGGEEADDKDGDGVAPATSLMDFLAGGDDQGAGQAEPPVGGERKERHGEPEGRSNPAEPPATPHGGVSGGYGLTREQAETYAESIPVIERVAGTLVARLERRVAELERRLDEAMRSASTAAEAATSLRRSRFETEIRSAGIDVDGLLSDQRFQKFLATTEPVSGATYRDLLAQAVRDFSASRVVAIFKAFGVDGAGRKEQRSAPAAAEAPAGRGDSTSAPARRAGGIDAEKLVAIRQNLLKARNAGSYGVPRLVYDKVLEAVAGLAQDAVSGDLTVQRLADVIRSVDGAGPIVEALLPKKGK